jgi:hypothetical protein
MQEPSTASRRGERSFGRVTRFRLSELDDERRDLLRSLADAAGTLR